MYLERTLDGIDNTGELDERPEALKRDIRGRLRDKIMFGSDSPSMPLQTSPESARPRPIAP